MPVSEERADVLVLDVPAGGDYLSVVPTATAAVATRLGFSLEAIEDLRAAVNAAVTLLVSQGSGRRRPFKPRGEDDGQLHCRLEVGFEHLQIVLSRPGSESPDSNAYQWQVLRALADEVESQSTPAAATIRILQQRPPTEGDADTEAHRLH